MYETILVPIDGSDGGDRAVEHALELSERYDAGIHVLYVVDTSRYGEPALSSTEIVVDALEDEGTALLKDVAERADDHGIEVTLKSCHGAPYVEIIEYADEIDADLVVMGHQGRAQRPEGQIGSTANRVARLTTRPILLV